MAAEGTSLTPMSTLVLAYGFGHSGMMLSPIHLCLLVTRDYFRSSFSDVYRRIVPCVLAVLAYSIAAHIALKLLGI